MNGLVLTEKLVARSERFEPDPGPDTAEPYLSDEEYCESAPKWDPD